MEFKENNKNLTTVSEESENNILIPIKAIVENRMENSMAFYSEDEMLLLRRYFIACLNLGYFMPEDLPIIVNKFTSKIKSICYDFKKVNKMDYYLLENETMYIYNTLYSQDSKLYEINFFKGVTEVIFQSNDKHIGISNAICEMTAEKIYNIDVNKERIIMPVTKTEFVNDSEITIRAGYYRYNLIISLLKQLFIAKEYNENKIIRNMFVYGYEQELENISKNKNNETDEIFVLLLNALDDLCNMYINRIVCSIHNDTELIMLEKYQKLINKTYFNKKSTNHYAFCALITNDELRNECLESVKSEKSSVCLVKKNKLRKDFVFSHIIQNILNKSKR